MHCCIGNRLNVTNEPISSRKLTKCTVNRFTYRICIDHVLDGLDVLGGRLLLRGRRGRRDAVVVRLQIQKMQTQHAVATAFISPTAQAATATTTAAATSFAFVHPVHTVLAAQSPHQPVESLAVRAGVRTGGAAFGIVVLGL